MVSVPNFVASAEENITPVTLASLLLMTSLIIVVCVLTKASPRAEEARQTRLITLKRDIRKIKKRAEKKKAIESRQSCCFCCCGTRDEQGPVPNPPFGIELQDPASSSVTILWNEPETEDPEAQVLSYKIYARFKAKSTLDWTHVGKVKPEFLEHRIKNLVAEKRYVFGVSCKGKHGESDIVESKPLVLKRDPVRPGAPSEFHCTSKTSSSVTLCWKPPVRQGHARIHTYYLTKKDFDTRDSWLLVATLQAFDRYMDYKVTGLKIKHQYRFRVTAENIAGIGPFAETLTIETMDLEPQPPGRPRGPIKYARISYTSITVSWQPPSNHGGSPISGYAVEYKEKNSVGWRKAGVVDADRSRHTVTRLPEDVEFVFRVIAINNIGNSPPLLGGKVKTKLLAIPLSRRSSFRELSNFDVTRGTNRTNRSGTSTVGFISGHDVSLNLPADLASESDRHVLNSPFVPKSAFYSEDETDFGSISTRHSENRTRHSQYSPLPKMGAKRPGYMFQAGLSAASTVGSRKRKHSDTVRTTARQIVTDETTSGATNGNTKDSNAIGSRSMEASGKLDVDDSTRGTSPTLPESSGAADDFDINYVTRGGTSIQPTSTFTPRYQPREHHLDYHHTKEDLKDYRSPGPNDEYRFSKIPAYPSNLINVNEQSHEEPISARSGYISYQIPANMSYNK